MKRLAIFLLFAGFALPAGDPAGFHYWSAAELKAFSKSLSPKINAQKVASQPLTNLGNYEFAIAHREGSGEAEYHEVQADIFVPQSGEATLVYGGKIVNGKTTGPGEIRGSTINGGLEKRLVPGDVVTIPAKLPHMLKLASGKTFTYFVIKVTQP